MGIALSLYIIEISSKIEDTSVSTEGHLTRTGLSDEPAELDDDGAHVLDILTGHRLRGIGRRGCTRAGTDIGNAEPFRGRHTTRSCAQSGRGCWR